MRGYLRRRAEGSWEITIELGRDPKGRRMRRTHTVRGSRRAAEEQRVTLLHALKEGTYVEPSKETVAHHVERWLRDVHGKVAPQTYERYEQIVRTYLRPTLAPLQLARLRPLHIVNAQARWASTLSPRSCLHLHRVLHAAMTAAVQWQLLAVNPASAVRPPRAEAKEMRALDVPQAARLLQQVNGTEFEAAIVTALHTGLRIGELLGLRWKDLSEDRHS